MDKDILLKDIPINMFHNKSVLITGATGIVGTHFLSAFRDMYRAGVNVNVFAVGKESPPDHLSWIFDTTFISYKSIDLSKASLHPAYKYFDFIIHAASYGQPRFFMTFGEETIILNVVATLELLKRLAKDGKFLFISSSELYSGLGSSPYSEDMIGTTTPSHPRAGYIEGKRCGEAIVNMFRNDGVDAKSVRLSLAYGEGTRKDDQRVLNMFIKEAIVDKHIKVRDSGQAIRKYCYVGDAVNMMLRVMLQGREPVYNIGGPLAMNIAELAYMIANIAGASVERGVRMPKLKEAPDIVNMSIQRYIDEFGPRCFVSMEEGLRRTIEFQRKLYE
jgi:UDP-glucuronate decarboxylase